MSAIAVDVFTRAVAELLTEVGHGPPDPRRTWIVSNDSASGLTGTLAGVSAAAASHIPAGAVHSLAGHAGHLEFALDLFNRAARGDNPYPTAKWAESWRSDRLDERAWDDLRRRLANQVDRAIEAVRGTQRLDDPDMITGGVALVAHVAYHLGAIRQLAALARADSSG